MVQIWAAENMTTNLRVNLLSPGPIRTRMRAQAMPGEDPETLETPEKVADQIVAMSLPGFTDTGKVYVWSGETASQLPRAGLAPRSHRGAGNKLAALEAHPCEVVAIFRRRHAGMALEQLPEERDVLIADLRADILNRRAPRSSNSLAADTAASEYSRPAGVRSRP